MKYLRPRRLILSLTVLCLLLLMADLFIHHHSPLPFLPNFSLLMLISFAGCILFIALSLALSPLMTRKEDYYDD